MEGPAAAGCPGCFLPSGRDVGPVGTLGGGRGFRAHADLSHAGHTARGGWGHGRGRDPGRAVPTWAHGVPTGGRATSTWLFWEAIL